MPKLPGDDPAGATPLTDDDLEGLIPTFVATRADLNVAEQANIEAATRWAFRGRSLGPATALMTVSTINAIHRRMFGEVWRWAGKFRIRDTNIGVEWHRISTDAKLVLDGARYCHEHGAYDPFELAVRLHHGLVRVHPYRNGNGRHARFVADLYLHRIDQPRLAWGGADLSEDTARREAYIAALRGADHGDIQSLLAFAQAR